MSAGAMMSDELSVGMAQANVAKEVIDALRVAMAAAAVDPYALSYAHGMTKSLEVYGLDGLKTQVAYLMNNMGKWKGDEARAAKKILRAWSAT